MQTFLPYASFMKSARCLDDKRLGKQRVEAYTILRILTGQTKGKGWRNHPAVLMWRGFEDALRVYINACIGEWVRRGFNNNMQMYQVSDPVVLPPWLGDGRFHASHRSNLLRKNPKHYSRFGWAEGPDRPYFWPNGGERR